jgi:hypothetical protein
MSQSKASPVRSTDTPRLVPRPFELVSVEKTDSPRGGGSGDTWYNYVLDNGRSKIVGTQQGSLKSVTAYATQYAAELNARTLACQSVWSPRAKKPAA